MKTWSAIAEPHRLLIIELLRDGPLTVGQISLRLGIGQPQTSKHLRILSDAGFVEAAVDRNRRIYALRPDRFIELDAWLSPFRFSWAQRQNRLEDYLKLWIETNSDEEERK